MERSAWPRCPVIGVILYRGAEMHVPLAQSVPEQHGSDAHDCPKRAQEKPPSAP
jgi:hypothetical protein